MNLNSQENLIEGMIQIKIQKVSHLFTFNFIPNKI